MMPKTFSSAPFAPSATAAPCLRLSAFVSTTLFAALLLHAGPLSAGPLSAGPLSAGPLSAGPLSAQAGTEPITAAQAYKHLTGLNSELRTAWELFPKSYGSAPGKEAAAIAEAEQAVSAIVQRVQGRHKSAGDAFKALQANILQFNAQLKVARLAQAASAANAIIVEKHETEVPANAAELQLLTTAAQSLVEAGGEGWAPVTSWFQAQDAAHRKQALVLSKQAQERSNAARTSALEAKLIAAMTAAKTAVQYAEDALSEGGPVSPAILKEIKIANNKVTLIEANATKYWLHREQQVRLASALQESNRTDAAEMSALALEGALVGSGRVRSSTFKVVFKAEEDWCYVIAMRYRGSDEAGLSPIVFSQKGNRSSPQAFSIPPTVPGWSRLDGACTTTRGRVTARAEAEVTGGAIRWSVIGWPRSDVPHGLFAHVNVALPDRCDFDAWVSYWQSPVPGTRVNHAGGAHLVSSLSAIGNDGIGLINVAGGQVNGQKSKLQAGPGGTSGAPTYKFAGCPEKEFATHKRSKAINKCEAKVERRHARSIRKFEKRRDRAKSEAKVAKYAAKLEAAQAAEEADQEKTCGPKEARAKEAGERAYRTIIDLEAKRSAELLIDRVQAIKDDERAAASQ